MWIREAELAGGMEQMKITAYALNTEEMTKLWKQRKHTIAPRPRIMCQSF